MNKPCHISCGIVTATTVAITAGISFPLANATIWMPVSFVTVAVGSLLPDIDIATSSMGRKAPIFSKIFTHRGLTHTLLFPAIMLAAIILADNFIKQRVILSSVQSLLFGLILGWVVHIIADLFNSKGCPVFWPASGSKLSFGSFNSSGWQVWLFFFLYTLVHVVIVAFHLGIAQQFLP